MNLSIHRVETARLNWVTTASRLKTYLCCEYVIGINHASLLASPQLAAPDLTPLFHIFNPPIEVSQSCRWCSGLKFDRRFAPPLDFIGFRVLLAQAQIGRAHV